jgi:hypothetical protein
MTNKSNWRPLALSLTVLGAIARLLPHPPNFAPVGGMSLFAGARLPVWQAYLVPLALMAITDPILNAFYGFHAFTVFQFFTYGAFLIAVWIGRRLRSTESPWKIGAAVLASSVQFFLITNFGAFLRDYPHTFSGLAACYAAAIPFFDRTLLSDAFYAGVLFGLHAVLSRAATRERVAATA